MSPDRVDLLHQFVAVVWCAGRVDRCADFVHPAYRQHDPSGRVVGRGIDWFAATVTVWHETFGSGPTEVLTTVAGDETVAWRWQATAVVRPELLSEPLRAMADEIPELRVVRVRAVTFSTFDEEGLIVADTVISDTMDYLRQLGPTRRWVR